MDIPIFLQNDLLTNDLHVFDLRNIPKY